MEFSASGSAETPVEPPTLPSPPIKHGRNYSRAELMNRVWDLDVLECPRCHCRMRTLAAIHPPDATRKILDSLGLPSRVPPVAPPRSEFTALIEPF